MSLFADDAYGTDFVELPCEFCSELYPIQLLMEHQSSCRPDLLHFNFDDDVVPITSAATASPKVSAPLQGVEKKQKTSDFPKIQTPNPTPQATNIGSTEKQNKDPFEELLNDDDDEIPIIFEDNSQESGVKLMSYGSNVVKRTEDEKPSFRPPPLPLFNNQSEAKNISNILSDDDDENGESLEDFWRRADIKNTQRLRKLKT